MQQFVDVGDARLYVERDGLASNPALLLWPPGGSTLRVWDHMVPQIADWFHVIRIDIRGYGSSEVLTQDEAQFCFEKYAEDAMSVLAHFDIHECHTWSQSWGSRANLVFAANYPNFVKSAAVYAANTELPNVSEQRKGTAEAAKIRSAQGIAEEPTPAGIREHCKPDLVSKTSAAVHKTDLNSVLEQLTMPVLIGTGSHDPNLVSSRDIVEKLARAELVVFENVGHNAILEYPALALECFLRFQRKLGTIKTP